MARNYFYEWLPAVIVGTVVILALPWLAVIALLALMVLIVAGLGSLAVALVAAVKALGRSTSGHSRQQASQRVALQAGGVGGTATAFVSTARRNVASTPVFRSTEDQTEGVYEHPYRSDAWKS